MLAKIKNRKLLISFLWIIGFAVMIWGLFRLYAIFVDEKNSASYELSARKNTLEQYAAKAIQLHLQRELQQKEAIAPILKKDPLIINDDVLLVENGNQYLPRQISYAEFGTDIRELYDYIFYIDPLDLMGEKLSPWQERLTLLSHFKLAIDVEDANDIRWSFREIREHRTRNPVAPEKDIPFMVALLDYFLRYSKPEISLLSRAIRGGTIIEQEKNIPGLQRMLLLNRKHFTREEFVFLRDKVVSLSNTLDVRYDDFVIASELPESDIKLDVDGIDTSVIINNGSWYVEPRDPGSFIGVRIDIDDVIASVSSEMKQLGLLDEDERIRHKVFAESRVALSSLSVSVDSPRLISVQGAIEDHFVLKTTLLFVFAFMAFAIVVLATVSYLLNQRYLKVKSDFIAAVSHELRTPLASIRLMSETLQRRLEGVDAARDYPQRIVGAVDSLSLLVDNILSYNRLNKGLWKPNIRELNLSELIGELKSEFKNYATAPLNITTSGIEKLKVSGDFELLKILFRNLISNAYKYNKHDSVNIEITAELSTDPVLLIKDNGIGIPEQNWKGIFMEFQRYVDDKENCIDGAGLGLALCKKIMQLHSGDIRVASSSQSGTVFELNFA